MFQKITVLKATQDSITIFSSNFLKFLLRLRFDAAVAAAAEAQRMPAGCASWTGGDEAGDSERGGVMVEKTVPLCATPPAYQTMRCVCVCERDEQWKYSNVHLGKGMYCLIRKK